MRRQGGRMRHRNPAVAVNIFAGGEFWFQWPSLAILLAFALRTISLFRRRI